ncbi:carbohydrate porin [Klebsiella sp. BIGb0407]|uniref:carbohydrate porin n=1 Tax=Klebsiella sp. BIGb0407 TaxID=2940603 RepID=UPI0021697289|nr:carbohydrate porin [Klebsiella sp. BIGb0407]MCS3434282.1 maltoporin [Klebsiella sp. BIGb0407]
MMMEKKFLTRSMLLCFSVLFSANTIASESFGFHGYIRAGSLFDAKDNYKKAGYAYEMEKVMGRLGTEVDNSWEGRLNKLWELNNGKSVNIHFNIESKGDGLQTRAAPRETGVSETYVELGGITPTGKLWGGLRYNGRDNYVFTTDYFYTDYSGTGMGVQDLQIGDGKWDFAYIVSNDTSHSDRRNGDEAIMHTVHIGAKYSSWDFEFAAKQMPENKFTGDDTKYATKGIEGTIIYSRDDFFTIPGGFSKVIAQAGRGLGAGDLLGATLTNTSMYRKSSLYQKTLQDVNDGYKPYQTKVQEGDQSYRMFVWGGWYGAKLHLLPTLAYQYNDHEQGFRDSWYGASLRSVVPFTEFFSIQTEVGYVNNDIKVNTMDLSSHSNKISFVPTFTVNTGSGPSPEIRLLATYVNRQYEAPWMNSGEDFLVGVQADMWW